MSENDIPEKIRLEFYSIAGFTLHLKRTNRLEDNMLRMDGLFNRLADIFFDNPEIIPTLRINAKSWLAAYPSETLHSLSGYIYYICEEYKEAAEHFFQSITITPENLDNWLDLAFSLYHLQSPYSYAILFNYDHFIEIYRELAFSRCHYFALEKISRLIRERSLDYEHTYREHMKYIILENPGSI